MKTDRLSRSTLSVDHEGTPSDGRVRDKRSQEKTRRKPFEYDPEITEVHRTIVENYWNERMNEKYPEYIRTQNDNMIKDGLLLIVESDSF